MDLYRMGSGVRQNIHSRIVYFALGGSNADRNFDFYHVG